MKYIAQLLSLSALLMVYQGTFSGDRKTHTAKAPMPRQEVIQYLQPIIQRKLEEDPGFLNFLDVMWAAEQTCCYYEQQAKQQQPQTPHTNPASKK